MDALQIHTTKRMRAIASLVPKGSVVCDAGCDHALVSLFLVREGICPRVYATDIAAEPLVRAAENVCRFGCEDKISVSKCDGLSGARDADCAIIAGMGGEQIAAILDRTLDLCVADTLIFCPMSHPEALREGFYRHGLTTDREMLVRDGKRLYLLIRARRTSVPKKYTGLDLYLGPQIRLGTDADTIEYAKRMHTYFKNCRTKAAREAAGLLAEFLENLGDSL